MDYRRRKIFVLAAEHRATRGFFRDELLGKKSLVEDLMPVTPGTVSVSSTFSSEKLTPGCGI